MLSTVLVFAMGLTIGSINTNAAAKPKLNKKSKNLTVGKSFRLQLKNAGKQATVKWASSDKKVAKVKVSSNKTKATVTGISVGDTTITAALNGKKYSCKVTVKAAPSIYRGIDEESPEWVAGLPAAASATQLFVVAAFSKDASSAWISMHEKHSDGTWHMVMTTPGFIGKNGLDKTKEGDAKTPTGEFKFNRAFGIAHDPGCAIPYVKVDENTYWSGDGRDGMHYNELVSTTDRGGEVLYVPDLDVASGDSEHLCEYLYHYQYCLNISYNEEGTPGLGSAIFLHCFGPAKPFTGGCVAIPEDYMKYVMQHVDENTAVVINTYDELSGGADWPDSTWPATR